MVRRKGLEEERVGGGKAGVAGHSKELS